jgi:hypothetical protein
MTEEVESPDRPAGIEYHGIAGASADCEAAMLRLLTSGGNLARALILTSGRDHAFLLFNDVGDPIAIKSGFASGYGGAGPTALSRVVEFLNGHGVEIDEVEIPEDLLERLDDSALTLADVDAIERGKRVRPGRWSNDYIREHERDTGHDRTLWQTLPSVMPYAILDPRLVELALDFETDADGRLNRGYRRLEDIVRERTGLKHHGAKLFSAAFQGETPLLAWDVPDPAEAAGRALLFAGIYMAYRNPRAHREMTRGQQLAEFLLLNQLFRLEADAIANPAAAPSP